MGNEYGITCALIATDTDGVDVSGTTHWVPFMNCPTTGTNVVMPICIAELGGPC